MTFLDKALVRVGFRVEDKKHYKKCNMSYKRSHGTLHLPDEAVTSVPAPKTISIVLH